MGTIKNRPLTKARRNQFERRRKVLFALSASIVIAALFAFYDAHSMNDYDVSSLLILSASNTTIQRTISHKVPPISCSHVLEQFRSGDSVDPNDGKLFVRYTSVDPPFWISFHNKDYDRVRFSTFDHGKYYETKLSDAFAEILSAAPPKNSARHRVIDVGGNIGWFTLLAAANGAEVSTFEPNSKNYLRMCESMRLNGWLPCSSDGRGWLEPGRPSAEEFNSNIHIYPYGVAEKEGELFFETDARNPGASRVIDHKTNQTESLRVVSLDGMARELGWLDAEISILKIDVEGQELGVFLGAKVLLRSKRVQNLFMEGSGRDDDEIEGFKTIVRLLVESGYEIFRIGGFRGPQHGISSPADGVSLADHYFEQCVGGTGKKRAQCNLWWKPARQL